MTSSCSCDAEGETQWSWNDDWKPYVRMKHQASVFTINKCIPNALICVLYNSSLMNTGSFFYSICISNSTSIPPFNNQAHIITLFCDLDPHIHSQTTSLQSITTMHDFNLCYHSVFLSRIMHYGFAHILW